MEADDEEASADRLWEAQGAMWTSCSFITFTAAMDRARDEGWLWQAPERLFLD
jgi:hypothetical protein